MRAKGGSKRRDISVIDGLGAADGNARSLNSITLRPKQRSAFHEARDLGARQVRKHVQNGLPLAHLFTKTADTCLG
jgi:hypothetical protein